MISLRPIIYPILVKFYLFLISQEISNTSLIINSYILVISTYHKLFFLFCSGGQFRYGARL
ncbi:hypothetical protein C1646_726439 [Rhizophagus diaphanus]|nr:hypothetical protein C1646_726439 [Rhizophagus diaphanus] [Rhizophagus sp. MUCL 43196]